MRSHGEGSIVQRSDGRWQGSLQVGGVRKTVYGKTRKQVVEKLEALKREAERSGKLPSPAGKSVSDLLNVYLQTKVQSWRPRTLADAQKTIRSYVEPALGSKPLAKLNAADVLALVGKYQGEGKDRTALRVYRLLNAAFKTGIRLGWLSRNPCEAVDTPAYKAKRRELWSHEELKLFLAETKEHRMHALWLTAAVTGCRLGELLALEWPDVSAELCALRINKSRQRIKGAGWVTTPPKTKAGERIVPVPPAAIEAIMKQRIAGESRVFPWAPETIGSELRKECRRLGLPPIGMHQFRHLHASLLLADGLSIPEVSQRLGHANPAITLSVYSHVIHGDRAVEAIERVLG